MVPAEDLVHWLLVQERRLLVAARYFFAMQHAVPASPRAQRRVADGEVLQVTEERTVSKLER
jgi:hypothetical protein